MSKINIIHGEGGIATQELIKSVFYNSFNNEILLKDLDSATFELNGRISYTTDSFVVKPLFFNGGDIGSLAVHGTVNDLVTSGARPLYLSTSYIIEEGFDVEELKRISKSMANACINSGVKIVTGDTKVVSKNDVDGVFINTSGIGIIETNYCVKGIEENDAIIITGSIAEHGTVILNERYQLNIRGNLKSDSAPLTPLLNIIKPYTNYIKIMKDPTRGGVGSILNELSNYYKCDIEINERTIPIRDEVIAVNKLLGIDPLYVASEGRMIIVINKSYVNNLLMDLKKSGYEQATEIGLFTKLNNHPNVYLNTSLGGKRFISPLDHAILPRIC